MKKILIVIVASISLFLFPEFFINAKEYKTPEGWTIDIPVEGYDLVNTWYLSVNANMGYKTVDGVIKPVVIAALRPRSVKYYLNDNKVYASSNFTYYQTTSSNVKTVYDYENKYIKLVSFEKNGTYKVGNTISFLSDPTTPRPSGYYWLSWGPTIYTDNTYTEIAYTSIDNFVYDLDIEYEQKKIFESSNPTDLSKLEVQFLQSDLKTGKINIKLEYRDYSNSGNYPVITGYRLYGKSLSSGNYWEEITNNDTEFFSNEKLDTTSENHEFYITLNTPDNLCVHDEYRIEFDFENTTGFHIVAYDDLSKPDLFNTGSNWNIYSSFLKGYRRYAFTDNYALISSVDVLNQGRIYFKVNDTSYLKFFNYNYETKTTNNKYFIQVQNDEYAYIEFEFSHNNKEVLLVTKDFLNNGEGATKQTVYIWIPENLYLSLAKEKDDNHYIETPTGTITESNTDIDNIFQYYEQDSTTSSVGSFLKSISQYTSLYSSLINYTWTSLDSNIRYFIIASFTVICICAIITIARK